MNLPRRRTVCRGLLAAALEPVIGSIISPVNLYAQSGTSVSPSVLNRPVRLLIGVDEGGATDAVVRLMTDALRQQTNWTILPQHVRRDAVPDLVTRLESADGTTLSIGVHSSLALLASLSATEPGAGAGAVESLLSRIDVLSTLARPPVDLVAPVRAPFDELASLLGRATEAAHRQRPLRIGYTVELHAALIEDIARIEGTRLTAVKLSRDAEILLLMRDGLLDAGITSGIQEGALANGLLKRIAPLNSDEPDRDERLVPMDDWLVYLAAPGQEPGVQDTIRRALGDAMQAPAVRNAVSSILHTKTVAIDPEHIHQLLSRQLAWISQH